MKEGLQIIVKISTLCLTYPGLHVTFTNAVMFVRLSHNYVLKSIRGQHLISLLSEVSTVFPTPENHTSKEGGFL